MPAEQQREHDRHEDVEHVVEERHEARTEERRERDLQEVEEMLKRHAIYTRSARAWQLLALWQEPAAKFVKVMPRDYQRVLEELAKAEAKGLVGEEALMAAFEANKNDAARVSGN